MRPNLLREIWQRGDCALNGWLQIPSGFGAELMAHSGWDSLTLDLQHGVLDYDSAVGLLQAVATTPVVPLARVPWNEPGTIMKMLDAGCYGIICPMINTRAECEAFVGACRYPPAGYRSIGPLRATLYAGDDYVAKANDTVLAIAMVETRAAVEQLDDILLTPGLDAIYIGPADLAQSYGRPPRMDVDDPEWLELLGRIIAAARSRGVAVGMHTAGASYARAMAERGLHFVTIASDARLLSAAARSTAAAFRGQAATDAGGIYR